MRHKLGLRGTRSLDALQAGHAHATCVDMLAQPNGQQQCYRIDAKGDRRLRAIVKIILKNYIFTWVHLLELNYGKCDILLKLRSIFINGAPIKTTLLGILHFSLSYVFAPWDGVAEMEGPASLRNSERL